MNLFRFILDANLNKFIYTDIYSFIVSLYGVLFTQCILKFVMHFLYLH